MFHSNMYTYMMMYDVDIPSLMRAVSFRNDKASFITMVSNTDCVTVREK